jgi:hypothetical protein
MKLRFADRMSMRGVFAMRIYRRGKLIETYQDHNLIVDGAREVAAQLISGVDTDRTIAQIAFGTNGSVPQPSDTLITGAYTKSIELVSYPALGQAEFHWSLLTTEANGMDIFEFGLLCADGTLYARKVREKAFPKNSDFALEGEWIIFFKEGVWHF